MYVGMNRGQSQNLGKDTAFPMYVGMNRELSLAAGATYGVPHVRGDEPDSSGVTAGIYVRSPCTWG